MIMHDAANLALQHHNSRLWGSHIHSLAASKEKRLHCCAGAGALLLSRCAHPKLATPTGVIGALCLLMRSSLSATALSHMCYVVLLFRQHFADVMSHPGNYRTLAGRNLLYRTANAALAAAACAVRLSRLAVHSSSLLGSRWHWKC